MLYKVLWEIEIEAGSHEEAAKEALDLQKDPDSMATVFSVQELNDDMLPIGKMVLIDPIEDPITLNTLKELESIKHE